MCTGGENSLILIKLHIYVQVFYMVRLPSKKKKKKKKKSLPIDPFFFLACYRKHSFFFFGLNHIEGLTIGAYPGKVVQPLCDLFQLVKRKCRKSNSHAQKIHACKYTPVCIYTPVCKSTLE